jgi:hypothetical protein
VKVASSVAVRISGALLGPDGRLDLFGGAVQDAVEGGHEPGTGQVGAEVALVLAAGDEAFDTGHGLGVVVADAGRRQVAFRRGEQAAVMVHDPPGGWMRRARASREGKWR